MFDNNGFLCYIKRMKKIKLIMAFAVLPFLCSFTSYESGKVVLEVHSLTKAIKILDGNFNNIESQNISSGGMGHSYIVIHNTKNYSINVGYYTLKPNDSVSMGLWTTSAVGSSIVSSSYKYFESSNSSGSSSNTFSHSGVIYNYERLFYTQVERPKDDVYLTYNLTTSKLNEISTIIKNRNDTYNVVTYNCAHFAMEIWNNVANKNSYNGWFKSPGQVRNEIVNDFKSSYLYGNYALKQTNRFFYYNKSNSTLQSYGW